MARLDEALARAGERVRRAYDQSAGPWPARVRVALAALLELCDERPLLARQCILRLAANDSLGDWRRDGIAGLVRVIDEGRALSRRSPPTFTAEGVAAGVLGTIRGRLLCPDGEPLVGLLDQLTSFVVLPYLGGAAARRELSPSSLASRQPASESPGSAGCLALLSGSGS